jgi:ribose-phosphate pyrophosphokinase
VSGRANLPLARDIATHLGVELGEPNLDEFANGEIHCRFGESIRGMDVFIVQSHAAVGARSVNDALMEHLIMVDAARRASAKRITAVLPCFAYARQDRKAEGREPITARLVADLFKAAGAKRMISVDLHSGQIQGYFDFPFDHLTALPLLADYFAKLIDDDFVVVTPDAGRVRLAEKWTQHMSEFAGRACQLAFLHKQRRRDLRNVSETRAVVGDVNGRVCVVVDDMIDTGGTLCKGAETLIEAGATEVFAAATHAVLSDPATDRIKNSPIRQVVVTNTLPIPSEKELDNLVVLSIAPTIAQTIKAVFEEESVSELFHGENQP